MIAWFEREVPCRGSVLFRGTMPPRPEEFGHLAGLGVAIERMEPTPAAHWGLKLRHPQWGDAMMVCLRHVGPPPKELIDLDVHLSEKERQQVRSAGSIVTFSVDTRRKHVLRDRKLLLRFLHAGMGDLGLAAMDHEAQRFWSRAALDEELSHDADLDIEGMFALHAVTGEESEEVTWLHSHGLAEMGFLDFDVVNPAEELLGPAWDMLRAIALLIVEGNLGRSTARITLAHPGGDVRSVTAAEFMRKAEPAFVALRNDPDRQHEADRVVLCEPVGRFLGRWFGRVRPSKFLSGPIEDGSVILFSHEASDLMARRARNTFGLFCRIREELAEFKLPVLVKIAYRVDGGDEQDLEHLWFEVHEVLEDAVDATLINDPHHIARMEAGQRGRHPVASMSDWQILTPAGSINPRRTTALRVIRENWDAFREALRKSREEKEEE